MIDLDSTVLEAVGSGAYDNPHLVLGAHPSRSPDGRNATVIRVVRPEAETVTALLSNGEQVPFDYLEHGIWEGTHLGEALTYRVVATYPDGADNLSGDPYRHAPTITEHDVQLLADGRHEHLWDVLGAHPRVDDGERGTAFTVWAPRARAVRVVGDHNNWNGAGHAMRSLGKSGIWELFIPDVEPGARYTFEILTRSGTWITKADPMAREAEIPPATASVVTRSTYVWEDGAWMTRRAATHAVAQPMAVYELHLGSWRHGVTYREAAESIADHVTRSGFTHVAFMPLTEHSAGDALGYHVTSYYAATSRYGKPDDLRYLIDRLHQAGIGVIIDWVPAHFAHDPFALARFDGEALYEHPDRHRGTRPDRGTSAFDYNRPEVRNFLVANALFWFREFHVDGLRVAGVESMLYLNHSRTDTDWEPNMYGGRENLEAIRLLQETNAAAHRLHPGIVMIADESTGFPGVTSLPEHAGLGFGFKWNTGWANDSLAYMQRDPLSRAHHQGEITFSFVYAFGEHYMLPLSHDYFSRGKGSLVSKMPGTIEQKHANVRAYLAYTWAHPGKKLLFMGQEFGQFADWSAAHELEWRLLDQAAHYALFHFVGTMNQVYRTTAPLWARDNDSTSFTRLGGPHWDPSVVAFARRDAHGGQIVCVSNFANVPRNRLELSLPEDGPWVEILNTDASEFGGKDTRNLGLVYAHPNEQGEDPRATLTLPALTTVWLRHQRESDPHVPTLPRG